MKALAIYLAPYIHVKTWMEYQMEKGTVGKELLNRSQQNIRDGHLAIVMGLFNYLFNALKLSIFF